MKKMSQQHVTSLSEVSPRSSHAGCSFFLVLILAFHITARQMNKCA